MQVLFQFIGSHPTSFLHFIIRQFRGSYPKFYEERLSASLFEHSYKDVKPTLEQPSNKFVCDKCDGKFVRKRDLKRHKISVYYGKKYECDHCALKFTRKDSMEEHERSFHFKEEALDHQCDICEQEFQNIFKLIIFQLFNSFHNITDINNSLKILDLQRCSSFNFRYSTSNL